MKKLTIVFILLTASYIVSAQSWNPYVNQGIISQLLPEEFGGLGEASFNIGNTGSSAMVYDHRSPDALVVEIQLSNGVPDHQNPLASLRGSWASMFRWTYDASSKMYTGVQKRTIPGYSQGTISVGYRVIHNSALSVASNGFQVQLQAPSYVGTSNTTQDDLVSSYTFTGANDYGDAPISYGEAKHQIDLIKNASGLYTKYIVLGSLVDQESSYHPSANANGDDNDGSNDEDGVLFPELKAGNEVTIPVSVTAYDTSYGLLNAWFDWNGDGDFLDSGEKVTSSPLPIFSTGTYELTFTIPEDAVTDRVTFSRFRIGNNTDAISVNTWGEVEDYAIRIKDKKERWDTKGLFLSGELAIDNVSLNWATASEYNTTFFRIERSIAGGEFVELGEEMAASGYSTTANSYEFIDYDVINELITYRIRLFDGESKELLSNTITIEKRAILEEEPLSFLTVIVYPNPVVDIYYVTVDKAGSYTIDVFDLLGRSVNSSSSLEVLPGKQGRVQLSRDHLSIGTYYLRVTDKKSGDFTTEKIIIIE